jgi:uncharacterized protein YjaZ
MILFHILNSSGNLTFLKKSLEVETRKSIELIQAKIPVDNVDIVIYEDKSEVIPGIGIGGFTESQNRVMLSIDPSFNDIKGSIKTNLKRTLAHELYHVLRNYIFEGKFSLLESLVNEGLADHFENEINNTKPNIWDKALNEKDLIKYTKLAEKDFDNYDYNHSEWFLGQEIFHVGRDIR